jgi:hypothetical protein
MKTMFSEFSVMYDRYQGDFALIDEFDNYEDARKRAEELRDKGIKRPIGYDSVRKITLYSDYGYTSEKIKGETLSW